MCLLTKMGQQGNLKVLPAQESLFCPLNGLCLPRDKPLPIEAHSLCFA